MIQDTQTELESSDQLYLHLYQHDQRCALPVHIIREVLTAQRLLPIPGQPPEVLGTLHLRGEVLPVLSLGYMLHGVHSAENHHILILQQGEQTYGLAIERLWRVWPHEDLPHKPLPDDVGYSDWVINVMQHQDDLVLLLHPPERMHRLTRQLSQAQPSRREEATQNVTQPWLSFWLQNSRMALPLGCISEILQMDHYTHIPLGPPSVGGIINVRGQIVPVVNLSHRLRRGEEEPWHYIILIKQTYLEKPLLMGVTATEVSTVIQVAPQSTQAPQTEQLSGTPYLAGLTICEGQQVLLLSVEQLLDVEMLLGSAEPNKAPHSQLA